MRLLLGSGGISTIERKQAWVNEINDFLSGIKNVVFVPYALQDYDQYTRILDERGFHGSRKTIGIHTRPDPIRAIEEAEAISVGGGNTFRLLNTMYENYIVDAIRRRVQAGVPYVGVSAGSNAASPTLKTTNDMPIVYPPSFTALSLIPFQINPHYFSGPIHFRTSRGYTQYAGETRDDRIREFHEMNATPVLGLWEGSILRVEDGRYFLKGHEAKARLFRKNENHKDFSGEVELTDFLPRM
jgi:dipeptidase E